MQAAKLGHATYRILKLGSPAVLLDWLKYFQNQSVQMLSTIIKHYHIHFLWRSLRSTDSILRLVMESKTTHMSIVNAFSVATNHLVSWNANRHEKRSTLKFCSCFFPGFSSTVWSEAHRGKFQEILIGICTPLEQWEIEALLQLEIYQPQNRKHLN